MKCCGILIFLTVTSTIAVAKKQLLYIMIDGFRYDYVDNQPPEKLPGFTEFLKNGVKAEYITPIIPTLSYPDWTTLVTGLYAESHGIVGNEIYDPNDKSEFSLFDTEKTGVKKWWTAEPIWTTATKAGLRVAVIYWSRCDVPFDNVTPEHCEPWVTARGDALFRQNIEKALIKLQEGFDLVQVYYEHIDTIGHETGPNSPEIKLEMQKLDRIIAFLQTRLQQMKKTEDVNIIIVSDHGMTSIAPGDVERVELDDYLISDQVEKIVGNGAFINIKAKPQFVDQVYSKLKMIPGVSVFRREDIPNKFHYKNNEYIHDIIVIADIDTWIMPSRSKTQQPPRDENAPTTYGHHGFSNEEGNMKGIFFAKGPDFLSNGTIIPPINQVDVYPLISFLLDVKPNPNNGSLAVIRKVLRDQSKLPASNAPPCYIATIANLILSLFCSLLVNNINK